MTVIGTSQSGTIRLGGAAPGATDASQVVGLSPAGNTVSLGDIAAVLHALLGAIANPISADAATGRLRISIENLATGQTLTTVTTVGTVTTVTSLAQLGGTPANSMVLDMMQNSWANTSRRLIT